MSPISALTSEKLLALVRVGDTDAFGLLHERHASFAMGVAMAVTRDRWAAEDAVQEAFLALWRSADRYDPNLSLVTTWLAMIVRRRAIEQLRRRRMTSELPDGDGLPIALITQDPWKEIAQRLDRNELVGGLAKLRATQRDALTLAFFAQLTHTEVADQLGLPLGTAKSRIRAGLRALRAIIPAESVGSLNAPLPRADGEADRHRPEARQIDGGSQLRPPSARRGRDTGPDIHQPGGLAGTAGVVVGAMAAGIPLISTARSSSASANRC